MVTPDPTRCLEPFEQPLDVIEFDFGTLRLTETTAQFFKDLSRALRFDFTWHLYGRPVVWPIRSLWPSKRVERCITCTAISTWHLLQHALRH